MEILDIGVTWELPVFYLFQTYKIGFAMWLNLHWNKCHLHSTVNTATIQTLLLVIFVIEKTVHKILKKLLQTVKNAAFLYGISILIYNQNLNKNYNSKSSLHPATPPQSSLEYAF